MSLPPAIKSSGIALVAIGGLALAIVWGAPLLKERAKGTRPALAMWMLCLLAALGVSSVSSYWYLRNYVHTGTPLYPVGVSLHGQVIFPGAPLAMAIQEEEGTPPQMRPWPPLQRIGYTWLQGLRAWPSSIETPESRLGGLGFIWAAGCLPAIGLLALSPKLRPNPQRSFWLLLVVTGAAFITMPMNWWARYTVWIYALGLPCLAVAIEKVLQARRAALFGVAWGGACALLLIFEGAHAGIYALDATFPGALVQSPRSALTPANWRWSYAYLFPELEGTAYDQLLAEASIVAIGPANWPADAWPIFGIMGQLSQPIGARHVVHLGTKSSAADLAAQSVQFVVWDKDVPLPQDIAAVVADSQTAGQFLILRLSPPG
jgi:hypothetical protein